MTKGQHGNKEAKKPKKVRVVNPARSASKLGPDGCEHASTEEALADRT